MKTITLTKKEHDALFHILNAAYHQWPNWRREEFISLLKKVDHPNYAAPKKA